MEPQHQPPERRPSVPPGFHFTPSPEELIHSYLSAWITGQPLDELEGIVCFVDVYSRDPATLTKFKNFCYDGHWYFFCVSKWKGGKAGGRVSRCVGGGGTWHNTLKRKPVGEDGCCRMTFEYRDAGDRKTGWLMEEFASNLEEATDGTGVKVICKVYLSRRAPAPDEEERQATRVVGSKRPALHGEHGFREAAVSNVAPSPAETGGAAVVGCSNAVTSQAAPMAWLQSMLESMSKPVYYYGYGGVDIKREPELPMPMPMPLAMASANGEVLQFAQTDGLGAAVDAEREDVSPDEWLDRILSFNDGAGDADDPTGNTATATR